MSKYFGNIVIYRNYHISNSKFGKVFSINICKHNFYALDIANIVWKTFIKKRA